VNLNRKQQKIKRKNGKHNSENTTELTMRWIVETFVVIISKILVFFFIILQKLLAAKRVGVKINYEAVKFMKRIFWGKVKSLLSFVNVLLKFK
jgi:hypothetical protein